MVKLTLATLAAVALLLAGCGYVTTLPNRAAVEAKEKPCPMHEVNSFPRFVAPENFTRTKLGLATTDFSSGKFVFVDLLAGTRGITEVPIHSDAIVKNFPPLGDWFVINRQGQDNLQILNADGTGSLSQMSLGKSTNPQDIAIQENLGWVTRHNRAGILKIDWQRSKSLCEVDLAPFSDGDGLPEATWIERYGEQIWVALQRLDHGQMIPTEGVPSRLVVLDAKTDSVVSVVDLELQNPWTPFRSYDGRLYLGSVGRLDDGKILDGGIESWDPNDLTEVSRTAKRLASQRTVVTEKVLGGDILDFAILNLSLGVAVVGRPRGATRLVAFDPDAGILLGTIADSASFDFRGVLKLDAKSFVLSDGARANPRLRVFSHERIGADWRWVERGIPLPLGAQAMAAAP